MKSINILSAVLLLTLLGGCTSISPENGPRGPEVVSSGRTTQDGQYAEIGIKFTSTGDLFALFSPSRWSSPVATGGSLSWLNPAAWNEDAGRTGRILLGEAVMIGGAFAVADNSGGSSSSGGTSTTTTPPPPGGGGGGTPPPAPGP